MTTLMEKVAERLDEEDLLALRNIVLTSRTYELAQEQSRRQAESFAAQLEITSQDRDNRRRRMELAMLILDEQQNVDAEKLWQVATGHMVAITRESYDYYTSRDYLQQSEPRLFGAPIAGDPTQQPTQISEDDQCTCLLPFSKTPGHHHTISCPNFRAMSQKC